MSTYDQKKPSLPKNRKEIWYKLDLSAIVYPTLQQFRIDRFFENDG